MDIEELQSADINVLESINMAFYRLWKQKMVVLLVTIIGLLTSFLYVGIVGVHVSYYTRASIYSAVYGSYQDSADGVKVMNTYAGLLGTSKVCDRAAESLKDYGISSSQLSTMVNNGSIYLSGASSDSKSYGYRLTLVTRSSEIENIEVITNAMAYAFSDEINDMIGNSSLQVLDEADGYGTIQSIDIKQIVLLFTAGAFALSCFVIFVKEFFSKRVFSVVQCESDKDKVLGIIPYIK